jgi:hypothetical protein
MFVIISRWPTAAYHDALVTTSPELFQLRLASSNYPVWTYSCKVVPSLQQSRADMPDNQHRAGSVLSPRHSDTGSARSRMGDILARRHHVKDLKHLCERRLTELTVTGLPFLDHASIHGCCNGLNGVGKTPGCFSNPSTRGFSKPLESRPSAPLLDPRLSASPCVRVRRTSQSQARSGTRMPCLAT